MSIFWNNITKEDVIKAIELFDSIQDTYPEPLNTFLLYNNKKYPAKHIRGLAYLIANNKEISKNDYSGGQETANFFRKRGFTVQYKKETLKPKKAAKDTTKVNDLKHADGKKIIKRLTAKSQKKALLRLLQKHYENVEKEKKFGWLRTPNCDSLPDEYKEIVSALSKYRNQTGFQISNYKLGCDFVIDQQKLIIEYDENQHFSKARKITLENYPSSIQLNYSLQAWIMACEKIYTRDNDPVDRDERRAFYDTVRDIEAFKHGYTLIRIKHGDFDWESDEAAKHLVKLLTNKDIDSNKQLGKHKIARLIVTGWEYDDAGNPNYQKLEVLIEKFISKVYNKQQFEFILTVGGFLIFEFPKSLQYNIDISNAEEKQIYLFQLEADKAISSFFENLPKGYFERLKEIADYFTIGIDGFNPTNHQKIQLVAVYDLKNEKVIRWTGKFYPTEAEIRNLVKINDLNTHFIKLNNQNVVILGCHDLNVYNPRGQAAASPEGWRRKTADKFKKLCKKYKPDIILQHPHKTFSPNNWKSAWAEVTKELSTVSHYASGINYQTIKATDKLRPIDKVLEKTKKGDVIDFQFKKLK